MAENKTLLLLALAGGVGFYFYNKSTSTAAASTPASTPSTPTDSWAGDTSAAAATGAATGGATLNPAAAALATAATSPALANVPDDVAQLALKVSVDLATTLAVVKYDAIIYGHPNELSTQYFAADAGTWQAGVQNYNESGLTELAQQVGVDPATVLAVVTKNYTAPNLPAFFGDDTRKQFIKTAIMQVITNYRNDRNSWSTAYASYRAANGLSGLAGGGQSALSAVSSALHW